MIEPICLLVGALFGGLLVYLWQQGLLKSERLLRDQIKEQYDARLRDLQLTRDQIDTTFKAAASTVLQQEAKQYREAAEQDLRQVKTEATGEIAAQKQAIQAEVGDLKGQLQQANQKIADFEKERSELYQKIANQLSSLHEQETKLLTETTCLKTALTTSGSVRGRWGELVLKNILIAADLTEGIDFDEQASTNSEDGDRLRPDVLIRLPNCGHTLAIDSKASLYESYLQADAAQTEDERRKLHQDFARKLRGRVQELGSKSYEKYVTDSVPFVVMFVPSESAIRAAFDIDPTLFQWAKDRRVMITSPVTIIPLILLIAQTWQQFKLSTAASDLAKAVEQLGSRLQNFMERLSRVQKGLESAAKAWNEAVEKSWLGQQSVTKSFDRIKELGGALEAVPELETVTARLTAPTRDEAKFVGASEE